MAVEAPGSNRVEESTGRQGRNADDVPQSIRRRYFFDERGGPGTSFYVDAQVRRAAFRDEGRALVTDRADPNAIRDMIRIAQYREWNAIAVKGARAFRREAWLEGRVEGLQVQGYRPSERDLQELERREARRDRHAERRDDRQIRREQKQDHRQEQRVAGRDQLRVVEAVVRARIGDPSRQDALMCAARERVADWLERGARFLPPTELDRTARSDADRSFERQRKR